MEDEDEFGDLYTDVLRPFSSTPEASPPPPLRRPIDLNFKGGDRDTGDGDEIAALAFNQTLESPASNSIDAANDSARGPRVLVSLDAKLQNYKDSNSCYLSRFQSGNEDKDIKFDIEDANIIKDSGPAIPGIPGKDAATDGGSVGEGGGKRDEDWEDDSDSEDDLQIVLNGENHGPMGMERGVNSVGNEGEEDDEDEDGEPLVIVGDVVANPALGEQNWAVGEEGAAAAGPEGERKEGADVAGKGIAMVVPKIGYSNHSYPHPFHSQFKYVRPGAAPIPGPTIFGPGGAPGQVRPSISPIGRGRGDWPPAGVKSGPMQKGFHQGFRASVWSSNMAGRVFGNGLEFTLPSHKTIFDVDIDSFEEKPWKYPGVDISDYFNFGLNDESWKDHCKLLEQHRLETTMQSKIRVYESGRGEQEYDPDLPPELAAATVVDVPVDVSRIGKGDAGQSDLTKGSTRVRPPRPTGRAIQVENGYGGRLPSIDTRPLRVRDSDAIIEIVLQDSVDDDSSAGNGVVDEGNDLPRDDFRGSHVAEDDMTLVENGYIGDFPETYDSRKGGKRAPYLNSVRDSLPEGDRNLHFQPEAPGQCRPGSRREPPMYPGGEIGTPHEDRQKQGGPHEISPHLTLDRSASDRISLDNVEEVSVESGDRKRSQNLSSANAVKDERDLSIEDELTVAEESSGTEKNQMAENDVTTNDALTDGFPHQSMKKKVISHVEQPVQEVDDGEESKAARSSDISIGQSGGSKDYQKWHDGIEDEVVQDGHSARRGRKRRQLDENKQNLRRQDRDLEQEIVRNRAVMKGSKDSYAHRDLDPSLAHHLRVKHDDYDRRKERENPVSWQRRDEDTHSRKNRTEDMRKRERGDDMESRHRSKMWESVRVEKDEYLHSRKRLDNGSYRVHYDNDDTSRHREREDSLKSRFEVADNYPSKRRKDGKYLRRELAEKVETLHGHREHSSHQRREREEVLEPRERDDPQRIRESIGDYHSVRHKDEVWRWREREEVLSKRDREETQGSLRTGRVADDKAWIDHARMKAKIEVFDKEHQLKDAVRSSEQQKRRDRLEDENLSRHKGHDGVHVQGNPPSHEDRRSRQKTSSSHADRTIDISDSQKVNGKKVKENMRRHKEPEGGYHSTLGPSRRN